MKYFSIIVKNSIFVIVLHLFICLFFYIPLMLVWELMWGIIAFILIFVYTCIMIFIYFFLGFKVLFFTNGMIKSLLSVVSISVLIFIITIFGYNSVFERIIRIPFYPLGSFINHLLLNDLVCEKHLLLIISIMPSLIMWIGLVCRKKKAKE